MEEPKERTRDVKMLIFLESDRDNLTYVGNTAVSFTCGLPEHYDLRPGMQKGKWYLGLIELALPAIKRGQKADRLYVSCSACELSCVGNSYRPIIAAFSLGEIKRDSCIRFPSVQYVPLRVTSVSELTLEVCGSDHRPLPELNTRDNPRQAARCSLALKWMPNTSPWQP